MTIHVTETLTSCLVRKTQTIAVYSALQLMGTYDSLEYRGSRKEGKGVEFLECLLGSKYCALCIIFVLFNLHSIAGGTI